MQCHDDFIITLIFYCLKINKFLNEIMNTVYLEQLYTVKTGHDFDDVQLCYKFNGSLRVPKNPSHLSTLFEDTYVILVTDSILELDITVTNLVS